MISELSAKYSVEWEDEPDLWVAKEWKEADVAYFNILSRTVSTRLDSSKCDYSCVSLSRDQMLFELLLGHDH